MVYNQRQQTQYDKEVARCILLAVFFIVGFVVVWVGMSSMEAKSFNRLTGGSATTLDAMFTELRVQGSEQRD